MVATPYESKIDKDDRHHRCDHRYWRGTCCQPNNLNLDDFYEYGRESFSNMVAYIDGLAGQELSFIDNNLKEGLNWYYGACPAKVPVILNQFECAYLRRNIWSLKSNTKLHDYIFNHVDLDKVYWCV